MSILGQAVQVFTLSTYFSLLKSGVVFFSFNNIIIFIIFLHCAASDRNRFPASLWHGDLLKASVLFLCSFHHSQQMSSLFKIFNSLMINQVISPTKIYNFML